MLSPLICGSFQDEQDEEFELLRSCESPKSRKPTRWHSLGGRSSKGNKNPYADRGLDKFSALLAELDSKRQKIYTQKGSEDISLLGFVYSNSDDYKPIVVKLKNKRKQPIISNEKDKHKTKDIINLPPASSEIEPAKPKPDQVKTISRIVSNIKTSPKKVTFDLLKNIKVQENLRQPAYYLSLITILILLLLTVFGRSFVILCTTLCWYFIPTIQSFDLKKTEPKKIKTLKKDYVKALSYNNKNDHEIANSKKTKTMKKAMSYNNNKIVKSTGTTDLGLSSPRSVLNGYKSPPQSASPPKDRKSFQDKPIK